MERTLRLLREDERSLGRIHEGLQAQGSNITFYWLRKFSSGRVKDPSVNRIEELHRYLTDGASLVAAE